MEECCGSLKMSAAAAAAAAAAACTHNTYVPAVEEEC